MSEQPKEAMQPRDERVAALRERLERSRAALLEALATLTERDFASEMEDGRSVLDLLAELAPAELADAAAATGTSGGGEAAAGRRRACSTMRASWARSMLSFMLRGGPSGSASI